MKRRTFIKTSGLFLVGAPFVLSQSAKAKYRTALIGCVWRGKNILKEAAASGRVQIDALCVVDANGMEITAEQVSDYAGDAPRLYKYHQELLEKEKPDIVIIATPDLWHALQTIDALRAGAHVFVEKPTGHTVIESRAMLKVAREAG